ncbi:MULTISPECIES: hypothetical protein [unclassified Lentimonas]|uniref:hypothetical protein n=1 Tax=unclassified Lentimonas TaxID=2630993 RepID=UPI0013258942|nr:MULTISPECIES: hypothetical protein [unclassified Lentimonas]CAA6678107.1 Unannotated [Lentimonas sp. CC4]CAA6686004.1 Unannotated [Lentimonas sp. CC6]CAA6691791.1 Unannotated [Lentimonas sp. CC19]CAA6694540.1 Unannotated [Lentimonas sp. CC10]CAA7072082.1 Unannotated [Lentimonas sp. CC11]
MKTNLSLIALITLATMLTACGKKEPEAPAPMPAKETAATDAVVAEAMEEVDAIVEAAQIEVAEAIVEVTEEVEEMTEEAVAMAETEVAEIQAEAAEEISEVVEEMTAELGEGNEEVEALKAEATKALGDSLMPKVQFP